MTDPIVITQNADGSYTIPAIQLVPAQPASSLTPVTVSPPPPEPATLSDAVVTGTVNGQAVSLTVQPGQRVQLIPGNFQCGCVWYANDGSLLYQNDYVGAGNPTPIADPLIREGGGEIMIPGLPPALSGTINDAIKQAYAPAPWHRGARKELLDLQ